LCLCVFRAPLNGGVDDDTLCGDEGNDVITGGQGNDDQSGGTRLDVPGTGGDVVMERRTPDNSDVDVLTRRVPALTPSLTLPETQRRALLRSDGFNDISGMENVLPCFTPGTIMDPEGKRLVRRSGRKATGSTRCDNGIRARSVGGRKRWQAFVSPTRTSSHLRQVPEMVF
jgi:hypothetical protein